MKKYAKISLLFLFVLFSINNVVSQIAIGEWNAHISYDHIVSVTGSSKDIYAASSRGIQIYKAQENHYRTLTTVKGLAEADISEVFYSQDNEMLCVGYNSGNFDLIHGDEITNFPQLYEQSVYPEKSINQIIEYKTQLLLATDFGVLEFKPGTEKFGNTYSILDGQNIAVYELATTSSYIYAATEQGIYYASTNAALTQPSSWRRMDFLPEFDRPFNCIDNLDEKVIVNYKNNEGNDKVYAIENNSNAQLISNSKEVVNDLQTYSDRLFIATNASVDIYNSQLSVIETIDSWSSKGIAPSALYVDETGLWVGDVEAGLLKRDKNGQIEQLRKNGPGSNNMFRVEASNGLVYLVRGGYNGSYEKKNFPAAMSVFQDRRWNNYNFNNIRDLTEMVVDPGNKSHIYCGSWGDGLIEFNNQKLVETYTETNSALTLSSSGDVRVRALLMDEENNVWMINHGTQHPVVVRMADGEWVKHQYDKLENKQVGDIVMADNGFIWGFLPAEKSVFVIDNNDTPSKTSDDIVKIEQPVDKNGSVYDFKNDDIYAIAKDLEGYVWLATEAGILVETQPSRFFQREVFQPSRLKISQDGNTNYLLRDNTVTNIVVDPGNRKWFGTERSGAFLFSENGDNMLNHFVEDNSPLLADEIVDMAIEEKSGEVFFITGRGVISYRGETSESKQDFSEAYVFPNPVKPDYSGPITITGLINDVNVKITDISGNLVYETVSEGGQAIWYGKDLNGRRVSSGVYLVFITNEDGSKTHVEKILFIK
jgi:ligand-binding sensor domain-containing protein